VASIKYAQLGRRPAPECGRCRQGVRAANGLESRWYQAAIAQKPGRIRVADTDCEVTFEPAGNCVSAAIDAAYEAKCPGSSAVPIMQSAGPKSAAVRIVPR
jgi:hypothetical protein